MELGIKSPDKEIFEHETGVYPYYSLVDPESLLVDIDRLGAGGGVGMYPGPLWWPGMGGAGGMYPGIGRGARVFKLLVELLKASQRIEWSTTVPFKKVWSRLYFYAGHYYQKGEITSNS